MIIFYLIILSEIKILQSKAFIKINMYKNMCINKLTISEHCNAQCTYLQFWKIDLTNQDTVKIDNIRTSILLWKTVRFNGYHQTKIP